MFKENVAAGANVDQSLRRGKTVEQIYQKKTQLEHILLRPDTYVGSIEHQDQEMFVFDDRVGKLVYRKISYVPALYKIFDEILVNAADNMKRDPKGMNLIEITIDKQNGSVSVMNNGQGVPVQIHKEHGCYVPELIFGHLLTSDNYDDNERKVTGGRNGYGAKLANVFSKRFEIETADKNSRKRFKQVYEQNMSKKHPPTVVDFSGPDFTRVTFWPDLSRMGMTRFDDDIVSLMMKRAYDICGSSDPRCKVVLNGKKLPFSTFQEYCNLYVQDLAVEGAPAPFIYERCGERWEVGMSLADDGFQQVSFVNSINTMKGGTHIQHVADQMVSTILKVVKGKNRGGIDIKPAHVKNHLRVFVNCLVENPAFDSQTKEQLTTKQTKFGSSCEVSEKMLKQIVKSGIVEVILDWVRAKEKVDMGKKLRDTKTTSKLLSIPKLEDANDAGGRNSADCTLILTEGDSAKSLAVAGLSVVGRDRYGVFPLKGKVLNVRDANYKQVVGNAEIQNLLKIVGLDIKQQYDRQSISKLRYGSIMLMTDQDHDGSHIKGLLINLVHHWWPSLIKTNLFLKEFVTPIVKVWKDGKGSSERKDERPFFTMNEYETWRSQNNDGKGWKSKYYKGLGTSTAKEAKEYFKDIETHELRFRWRDESDGEAIDLAFNKKRADDRKEWINGYEDGVYVDHSQRDIGYHDFVHKELVQFAKYDVSRSVPSVVDGFKPSQRKVLFCAFKRKLKSDIKVAQFVGYVSEQSAYHHGEVSLENTIVNIAQTFVGSNNANLLVPSGQFGTRIMGGKDHAAARYIYTRLSLTTRAFFHPDDDPVLHYLSDEGQSIEPMWYCPIIPVVLVNGADGIGVGWSTFVPNHNPRDLIRNIRMMLRGEQMVEMLPWYKGFKGTIAPSQKEALRYEVAGIVQKRSSTQLEITELPIKSWTQSYKEFLGELMPQDAKKGEEAADHWIEDYREYHTENSVHFVLTLTEAKMRAAEEAGFEKIFKLKTTIATSNMVMFDETGKIAKYDSSLDILRDFCILRRAMYDKRKGYLVAKLTRDKEILSNKARFILMVVNGELELRKKKKIELLRELKQLGFAPMSKLNAIMDGKGGNGNVVDPDGDAVNSPADKDGDAEKSDYDYLLGMNLWSLTYERVEEIKKQLRAKEEELDALQRTSIEDLWDRDLQALSVALDEVEDQERIEAEAGEGAAAARRKKGVRGKVAPAMPAAQPAPQQARAKVEDKSYLSRPVMAGSAERLGKTGSITKTTWTAKDSIQKVAKAVTDPYGGLSEVFPSGLCDPPQKKRILQQASSNACPLERARSEPRTLQRRASEPVSGQQGVHPLATGSEKGSGMLARLLAGASNDAAPVISDEDDDLPVGTLLGKPSAVKAPAKFSESDDKQSGRGQGKGRGRGQGRGGGKSASPAKGNLGLLRFARQSVGQASPAKASAVPKVTFASEAPRTIFGTHAGASSTKQPAMAPAAEGLRTLLGAGAGTLGRPAGVALSSRPTTPELARPSEAPLVLNRSAALAAARAALSAEAPQRSQSEATLLKRPLIPAPGGAAGIRSFLGGSASVPAPVSRPSEALPAAKKRRKRAISIDDDDEDDDDCFVSGRS